MNTLCIENITKAFGSHKVIDDLSFTVPEHSIFGFLGQNGAGKTTTMKMILGLLKPDSGKITVCGERVSYGQTATNRFVGFLPDVPEYYNFMRPYEYLRLCGEITGLSKDKIKIKSEELMTLVGLDRVNKKIGSFSRGMKQRLGIAQALLNEPQLLICDEPTSALDPMGRKEILEILHRVKGKTTVVFSTHILSDVERICDHVAVIHGGKLALYGSLSQIKEQHRRDGLIVEFNSPAEMQRFITSPAIAPFMAEGESGDNCVTLHSHNIRKLEAEVIQALHEGDFLPSRFEVAEPTLESLFMEVVK